MGGRNTHWWRLLKGGWLIIMAGTAQMEWLQTFSRARPPQLRCHQYHGIYMHNDLHVKCNRRLIWVCISARYHSKIIFKKTDGGIDVSEKREERSR